MLFCHSGIPSVSLRLKVIPKMEGVVFEHWDIQNNTLFSFPMQDLIIKDSTFLIQIDLIRK